MHNYFVYITCIHIVLFAHKCLCNNDGDQSEPAANTTVIEVNWWSVAITVGLIIVCCICCGCLLLFCRLYYGPRINQVLSTSPTKPTAQAVKSTSELHSEPRPNLRGATLTDAALEELHELHTDSKSAEVAAGEPSKQRCTEMNHKRSKSLNVNTTASQLQTMQRQHYSPSSLPTIPGSFDIDDIPPIPAADREFPHIVDSAKERREHEMNRDLVITLFPRTHDSVHDEETCNVHKEPHTVATTTCTAPTIPRIYDSSKPPADHDATKSMHHSIDIEDTDDREWRITTNDGSGSYASHIHGIRRPQRAAQSYTNQSHESSLNSHHVTPAGPEGKDSNIQSVHTYVQPGHRGSSASIRTPSPKTIAFTERLHGVEVAPSLAILDLDIQSKTGTLQTPKGDQTHAGSSGSSSSSASSSTASDTASGDDSSSEQEEGETDDTSSSGSSSTEIDTDQDTKLQQKSAVKYPENDKKESRSNAELERLNQKADEDVKESEKEQVEKEAVKPVQKEDLSKLTVKERLERVRKNMAEIRRVTSVDEQEPTESNKEREKERLERVRKNMAEIRRVTSVDEPERTESNKEREVVMPLNVAAVVVVEEQKEEEQAEAQRESDSEETVYMDLRGIDLFDYGKSSNITHAALDNQPSTYGASEFSLTK
eukprot:CAMPEP_0197073086 /NCGR_PEP_ID=MMETSP1384-20130603/210425_1 /TAXON_ID=29189 /ORGANISM="Ammonia sp." /LENGTH=654 /DNA_ID=CAMNT_0042511911 /DNA_START=33 /DNA_END=1997 /DNA_ORIENTATION=-